MSDFEENIEILKKKLKLAYDYIENDGCGNRPVPGDISKIITQVAIAQHAGQCGAIAIHKEVIAKNVK